MKFSDGFAKLNLGIWFGKQVSGISKLGQYSQYTIVSAVTGKGFITELTLIFPSW